MAKKKTPASRRKKTVKKPSPAKRPASPPPYSGGLEEGSQFELGSRTGRFIATMPGSDLDDLSTAVATVSKRCSLRKVCSSEDYPDVMNMAEADTADVIVFPEFRLAVLNAGPDKVGKMQATAMEQGMVLEEERWNFALGEFDADESDLEVAIADSVREGTLDYLRGYRDGLSQAIEAIERDTTARRTGLAGTTDFIDSSTATWGLQATGVVASDHSGAGVKIAILDTGCDTSHPDFRDRTITSESFIPETTRDRFGNEITLTDRSATKDVSGHGTHCIGTACGNRLAQPRYGVAYGAEVFNGKVLSVLPGSSRAAGADTWILNGIRWAIRTGCSVISMSLGSEVNRGESYLTSYETLANSAMNNGILIVAAAGNESDRRNGVVRPVGSPANCPSIVSVGAVNRKEDEDGVLGLANFTNRHLNDQGGEVNFCGPGVGILSSFPSRRHKRLNGTSQATPHVAGIAALVQEETGKTGRDLYRELRGRVKPQGPRQDYGNGLIHV